MFCIHQESRIREVSRNVNINNGIHPKQTKCPTVFQGAKAQEGSLRGPLFQLQFQLHYPLGLQSSVEDSSWRIIVPYAWDFRAKAFQRLTHTVQIK